MHNFSITQIIILRYLVISCKLQKKVLLFTLTVAVQLAERLETETFQKAELKKGWPIFSSQRDTLHMTLFFLWLFEPLIGTPTGSATLVH